MSVGTRRDGRRTRAGLLAAATRVFAERGYRSATTAEICESAGANGAAINYHFGGKRALYETVWREAVTSVLRRHPPEGRAPPGAPVEERLRSRIHALLLRMLDSGPLGRLLIQELAQPTGLIDPVRRELLAPVRRGLIEDVRELLGAEADDDDVALAELCVINQCLAFRLRPIHLHEAVRREDLGEAEVAHLADQVTRFSLGGLARTRAWIEARRPT